MGSTNVKKQYIAVRGITFEGLKGRPHVEAGDPIPLSVAQATLEDLLSCGDIEEVKED